MVVVIFWSSFHCYEINYLDTIPAQEATTTNQRNQSGEIRWRGALLTSERVNTWPVFLVHVGKGNWKGNPVGHCRDYVWMFVVRMLQRALMQIVWEVPDGPRKRKQNAIGTSKKKPSNCWWIVNDSDIIIFDKLTKSHCTCTAQQVDRDISECEGGAAKTCWSLDEHVGWLMKRVFWYLGLGKMMVKRALAVLMLDLGLKRHIGYYMVLLWISTFA